MVMQRDTAEDPGVNPGRVGRGGGDPFFRRPPTLPPLSFKALRMDGSIKVIITDRGRLLSAYEMSDAVRYDIHWTKEVDTTSEGTVKAGFARSVIVCSAPASGKDDGKSLAYIYDPDYFEGFLYATGVSKDNERGEFTGPIDLSAIDTGEEAPPNVEHLQITESGEYMNGTLYSAIEWSCVTPASATTLGGIQFIYQDYPVINQASYGSLKRFYGAPGSSMQGKDLIPAGRRPGTGTVTVAVAAVSVVGGNLLSEANAGDHLEAFGHSQEILSVTDNDNATLAAAWTGPTVTSVTDWKVIAKVRIYVASVSRSGVSRDDYTALPYKDVLLDGLLGVPNAPASITVTNVDNGIRIDFPQVSGNGIASYNLYRSKGTADTFLTSKTLVNSFPHDTTTPTAVTMVTWTDKDFTIYEREIGQVYRYYVTAVNVRGQESTGYMSAYDSCRLGGGDDTTTGRKDAINLLWNGHICGTNLGAVLAADGGQDAGMGIAFPPLPVAAAQTRWYGTVYGGAALVAGHQNVTEVIIPANGPGAGLGAGLAQDIPAWDNGTVSIVDKGGYVNLSIYAYTTGGLPGGTLYLRIGQFDAGGGGLLGYMLTRIRLSDDSIDETGTFKSYSGSDLPNGTVLRMNCAFKPDTTLAPTTHIIPEIFWLNAPIGPNIIVTRAILAAGVDMPMWSSRYDITGMYPPTTGTNFRDPYREDTKPERLPVG